MTTQIFDRIDPHLEDDSVFAVKDLLIVDVVPLKGYPTATLELKDSITLVPIQDLGRISGEMVVYSV